MKNRVHLLTFESRSPEQTAAFARSLARLLDSGDALSLEGTLGAGKTHFAQGLAYGLGVPPETYVTSPTFTIINQYACEGDTYQGPFFHLYLYRLEEPDELFEIGYYDLMRGGCITTVEWWDNFPEEIPDHTLFVHINITGDETRQLVLESRAPELWQPRLANLA